MDVPAPLDPGGVPLVPPPPPLRSPSPPPASPPSPPPPPPPPAPLVARRPLVPVAPAVSEAVLAIPLGTRDLVRQSLDLLTRRDAGLRGASFYIGFVLLVTFATWMVILGLAITMPGFWEPSFAPTTDPDDPRAAWYLWLAVGAVPGLLGYIAAGTDARSMATAVIGGRVEGRPLRLRESIALARRRFWPILGALLLVGVLTTIVSSAVQLVVEAVLGPVDAIVFGVSLLVSLVVSAPFVYVPAGIILGEVGVFEAISRSIRLVRLRKGLAVVVTLFGVLGQFIVLLGLSQGLDVVARLLIGAGVVEDVPRPLVVPIAAALVFALGTLTFLVEAITAAPAVHAFAALTHYTRGLEQGRHNPVRDTGPFSPWFTPALAVVAVLAVALMVGAVLSMPA